MMVDISAQHDGPQRPHQEAGTEGGKRQHQRREFARGGKEGGSDGCGIVREDLEIVHFQRISHRDTHDGSYLGFAGFQSALPSKDTAASISSTMCSSSKKDPFSASALGSTPKLRNPRLA